MTPDYSIIIPAYNEERLLPATLASVEEAMAACQMVGELIVVDNNSTDDTARLAQERGARVVFERVNQISRARNAGARAAQGQFLVFVDADTLLPPGLLRAALENLARGDCCGGGALLQFDKPMPMLAEKALDLWNRLSKSRGLAAGCFIYCLRQGFDAVGGFSEKLYASEEIRFSRQLRQWGAQRGRPFNVIEEPRIVTSARKVESMTPLDLALTALQLMFPPAFRFRFLCPMWYRRPDGDKASKRKKAEGGS